MSSGMRALMEVAEAGGKPLSFAVSMYCGSMVISGRAAPAGWWYEVTRSAQQAEVAELQSKLRKDEDKQGWEEWISSAGHELDNASQKDGGADDEVTLVEVSVFPAVQTQGTESGGQTLPVARVPLSAIDLWWVVSGETIKGSGPGMGWGFLFPIGN
jgi:hypothetical protein